MSTHTSAPISSAAFSKLRLLKPDWPITALTHPCGVFLDLEIPAMPPPLLLDYECGFDDLMPPLPPPVDYDTDAPPQYLEKGTTTTTTTTTTEPNAALTVYTLGIYRHRSKDNVSV